MKTRLGQLITYAKSKGFSVEFDGANVLHDYEAMNPEAAKTLGFPEKYKQEIQISNKLSNERKAEDLRHELIERGLMKAGQSYWDAHSTALRLEKIDLPPKEINSLAKLGNYTVEHVHDDGDLTVKSQDKSYVVTTEGKLFEEKASNKPAPTPKVKLSEMPQQRSSSSQHKHLTRGAIYEGRGMVGRRPFGGSRARRSRLID